MFGIDVESTSVSEIIKWDYSPSDDAFVRGYILFFLFLAIGLIIYSAYSPALTDIWDSPLMGISYLLAYCFLFFALSPFMVIILVPLYFVVDYVMRMCLVFRKANIMKQIRKDRLVILGGNRLKPSSQIPEKELRDYYERALFEYEAEKDERTILEVKNNNMRIWLVLLMILLALFTTLFIVGRHNIRNQETLIQKQNEKMQSMKYSAEHNLQLDTDY